MKRRPLVIGFCGAIGAGKTTAAQHLVDRHGLERVRFAGPLKSMMRALGLSEREIDGDLKETPSALLCGRTPRHAMQTLGTEWGRDLVAPDLWISVWRRQAIAACSRGGVVADDVRFPNEVAAIRALGGIVVRVDRPGTATSGHASELQPLVPDMAIANDGDAAALSAAVDRLLKPARATSRARLAPAAFDTDWDGRRHIGGRVMPTPTLDKL